jgi:hypothetical protein
MERFSSVKSYAEFTMLKQTLVKETNPFKSIFNTGSEKYSLANKLQPILPIF